MELSISPKSQRNRAIRWTLAALTAAGLVVAGLALSVGQSASGSHSVARPAVQVSDWMRQGNGPTDADAPQAPAGNELTRSDECLNAPLPVKGETC